MVPVASNREVAGLHNELVAKVAVEQVPDNPRQPRQPPKIGSTTFRPESLASTGASQCKLTLSSLGLCANNGGYLPQRYPDAAA